MKARKEELASSYIEGKKNGLGERLGRKNFLENSRAGDGILLLFC